VNDPDTRVPPATAAPSHAERLFPRLTEAQIQRIAALGLRRQTTKGETLVEVGGHRHFSSSCAAAFRC
jgi:hypothetical protein